MRLTLGFATLAWVATGRAGRWTPLLGLAGAMKVAEGVTRYCPMLGAMGVSTRESVLPRSHQQLEEGALDHKGAHDAVGYGSHEESGYGNEAKWAGSEPHGSAPRH